MINEQEEFGTVLSCDLWIHHDKYATGLGFTIGLNTLEIMIKILGRTLVDWWWYK